MSSESCLAFHIGADFLQIFAQVAFTVVRQKRHDELAFVFVPERLLDCYGKAGT